MDVVSQYLKVHSRFVTKQSWIISVYAGIQAVFILLLPSKADIALSVASWSHSWWVSSALESGLHVLQFPSLGWYFVPNLRSGLCCCSSQMHKYLLWFGSESSLSQHQLQGGKSLSYCTREHAQEEKLVLCPSINQLLKLRLCSSDD